MRINNVTLQGDISPKKCQVGEGLGEWLLRALDPSVGRVSFAGMSRQGRGGVALNLDSTGRLVKVTGHKFTPMGELEAQSFPPERVLEGLKALAHGEPVYLQGVEGSALLHWSEGELFAMATGEDSVLS